MVGSLDLVQSLLRERLFDRIDLWLHPIVLGAGKKVFEDGAVPTNVTLLGPPVASLQGAVPALRARRRRPRHRRHERARPGPRECRADRAYRDGHAGGSASGENTAVAARAADAA
ncbi:dihydrofolate reductase family protein [Streptomyces sp. KL116D]|uniref:dihydrofolate reductase family protein n=1 Tax=Streptomyces sp. KL116D TaxID=3045152 RepID=UPI003557B10C